MDRFTANAANFDELTDLLRTARDRSYGCQVFVMSNGDTVEITHFDYTSEYMTDGYWVAAIYEDGIRTDI